jgi:hypothetical protein
VNGKTAIFAWDRDEDAWRTRAATFFENISSLKISGFSTAYPAAAAESVATRHINLFLISTFPPCQFTFIVRY